MPYYSGATGEYFKATPKYRIIDPLDPENPMKPSYTLLNSNRLSPTQVPNQVCWTLRCGLAKQASSYEFVDAESVGTL